MLLKKENLPQLVVLLIYLSLLVATSWMLNGIILILAVCLEFLIWMFIDSRIKVKRRS